MNIARSQSLVYGLVFVLYHPTHEHLAHLRKARALCSRVVAVDNSPSVNAMLHETLRGEGIDVIFNGNVGGISGALNRGADTLISQGCEVFILLDQDSEFDEQFFAGMMRACATLGEAAFIVGPKVYEVNMEKFLPVFPPEKKLPTPVRIDEQSEGLVRTLFTISSGSAISAVAYRSLGAFREDYFIEYVDIEYGMRASNKGVPVFINTAVVMRQTVGKLVKRGIFTTSNHVAWRRYYASRNAVHALRTYASRWSLHWLVELLTFHQLLCVLLCEDHKRKKIAAICCGYVDGVLGRLGSFERRHPKLASYCAHN